MKALAMAALLISLAACASSPTVTTDHDPAAQFGSYRTYFWAMKPEGGSPLVQQRIVDGIDARMRAKGFTMAENGDLALAAHVSTQQRHDIDTFYSGTGMGAWGYRGGWGGMGTASTTVRTYNVGTLVLDMFDSKTRQAVWRGTASDTVPSSTEKANALVEAALDKMLATFPPGSAAP
jgi:hypothetical protein